MNHQYNENTSDYKLVSAIRDDQCSEAFGILYGRYQLAALRYIRSFIWNEEVVKDIFQDFWLIAWTNPDVLEGNDEGSVARCVFAQLRFRILDEFRENKKWIMVSLDSLYVDTLEVLDLAPSANAEVEWEELLEIIQRFFSPKEWRKRTIFVMRLLNYPVKVIAELLEVSERWVYNSFSETRIRFVQYLETHHPEYC